ncbi:hypothetical protein AMECASPLE_027873, partial [Ameca splendens]
IVAGGSFTIFSKKNPGKLLLRGCACSNVLGLLGSLLAFCIYSYILKTLTNTETCLTDRYDLPWDTSMSNLCPPEVLAAYIWSLTLQMLLYDTAAVVMHFLLSVSAPSKPHAGFCHRASLELDAALLVTASPDNSQLKAELSAGIHVSTSQSRTVFLLLLSFILANHMEKLQDLGQSELQELLEHPERVESMALESDEIQNIQLEREMALASNRSLAEQNLDIKPRLESLKEALVARYSQLEAIRETYRQHCSQREGMVGQVSPEAFFSRLQTESEKTESESE